MGAAGYGDAGMSVNSEASARTAPFKLTAGTALLVLSLRELLHNNSLSLEQL